MKLTIKERSRYSDGVVIEYAYDRKVKLIVTPKGTEDDEVKDTETYISVDVLTNIAGLFQAHAATA